MSTPFQTIARYLALVAFLVVVFLLAACDSGGGGDSDDGDENSGSESGSNDITLGADAAGARTGCGVIVGDQLLNPVDFERGFPVDLVSVEDSNTLVLSRSGESFVVKLQGIGATEGFINTASVELYTELAAEPLTFFPTGDGCVLTTAAYQAQVGQIVTASGKSFTEELIKRKFAGVIETTGTCGEAFLTGCYQALSTDNEHHDYDETIECDETVPFEVRYRPADDDCGFNASVILSGDLREAFSIQLRYPDGTDRIIESCEEASCTPLKVQDYINTDTVKVGCFGAPGNSVALSDVHHLSIKREGDDHDPLRYCIPDPSQPIN